MRIRCPVCRMDGAVEEMLLAEETDSLLGLAKRYVYFCEVCGAKLEFKRGNEATQQ